MSLAGSQVTAPLPWGMDMCRLSSQTWHYTASRFPTDWVSEVALYSFCWVRESSVERAISECLGKTRTWIRSWLRKCFRPRRLTVQRPRGRTGLPLLCLVGRLLHWHPEECDPSVVHTLFRTCVCVFLSDILPCAQLLSLYLLIRHRLHFQSSMAHAGGSCTVEDMLQLTWLYREEKVCEIYSVPC